MIGKAERRRPLLVAIALIAAIGAALIAPVVIGARKGEPIPGSTVRASSREILPISTPAVLYASPAVSLESGTIALVAPEGQSHVGAALRALALAGGADVVLDGAKLVLDRSGIKETAGTELGSAAGVSGELAPFVSAIAGFKFRSLTLLDCTVVIESRSVPETISIVSAEIAPDTRGNVRARGTLSVRGQDLGFDATFALPTAKAPAAPVAISATVTSDLITASFAGRFTPGEKPAITAENAELSVASLRSFAGLLGASWPAGTGLGLFAAKGLLTLEPRAISFEHANFTLDGNIATGALTLKLGDERPLVEGTLDFETFDVTPYAAPSRPYALALASDWLSTIRIPGLASPSFLRDADADVRISAANVTSGSDRLGRCAASLSVRDGKLYGEIAELELEQGGRGEGQITIDTAGSEPRYTLHAALDDIDLSTVVAPRLGPAAIDGAGDIKLDVNASGASQADILRSLSGKVSLEMVDDGRIGLDIDALPAAAAASTPPSGWGTLGAGSTALSALSASFIAKDGILLTESVAATAGDRGVTAAGSIDIDKSALDLVISVAPASGAAAARPETLGAFRIHGPWSGPTVTRTGPGKAAGTPAIGKDPG
ncbi:MAG: AsmA-like C-terminal region-containing protein [Hyphomicrobium sp.]|uniref:AsmA family protein n=1 Tax=Hyphomicrobium sp. TaxID=82 RepID=UPI003D12D28F